MKAASIMGAVTCLTLLSGGMSWSERTTEGVFEIAQETVAALSHGDLPKDCVLESVRVRWFPEVKTLHLERLLVDAQGRRFRYAVWRDRGVTNDVLAEGISIPERPPDDERVFSGGAFFALARTARGSREWLEIDPEQSNPTDFLGRVACLTIADVELVGRYLSALRLALEKARQEGKADTAAQLFEEIARIESPVGEFRFSAVVDGIQVGVLGVSGGRGLLQRMSVRRGDSVVERVENKILSADKQSAGGKQGSETREGLFSLGERLIRRLEKGRGGEGEDLISRVVGARRISGIQVKNIDDGLRVVGVILGSPADQKGVRAGDMVLSVSGREIGKMTAEEFVRLTGTNAVLDLILRKESGETQTVAIGRTNALDLRNENNKIEMRVDD